MAPKIILTYFDIPGPAEAIRLALSISGEEWEDKRLSFEAFMAMKPTLPMGQLPTLDVDGKVLCQSLAILRFVGKRAGLYPEDPMEAAMTDMAADAVTDTTAKVAPTIRMEDKAKQMEIRKDLAENFLPTWLASMEKMLEVAGGKYFAGGKLSIGDLAVVCRLEWLKKGILDGIPATIVDPYPLLMALIDRVNSEPKIVAYHEARQAAAAAK